MADPSTKQPTRPPPPDSLRAPDSRSADRVSINREFTSLDALLQEYVVNISRSGVFIRSKAPLPAGTMVNLRFTVIMDDGDLEIVAGVGEVVRVDDNPPGMGVVFREISTHSKNILERLLVGKR